MVPPVTMRTKDDFELQMGTNHLGHYLLTRLLIPKLKKTAAEAQVSFKGYAVQYGTVLKLLGIVFLGVFINIQEYSTLQSLLISNIRFSLFMFII